MLISQPLSRATTRAFLGLFAAAAISAPQGAAAADYYAGKTITLLVGSSPGGGYDTYARTIARHWPNHIPGKPSILVKNQPGAGSGVAAAMMYTTAPKDGTFVAALFPGAIIGPILDPKPQAKFDPSKFPYLGSADAGTRVCITGPKSKVKTFEQAQKTKTIMGASQAGGSTRDYAYMLNHIAGTKFEVVSGYKGSRQIFLAMEKGEVDGMCGLDWSSLKSQKGDWVRDKSMNVLVQVSLEPEPELEKLNVPTLWPLVKDANHTKAARLIVGQQVFGRPYVTSPGTPAAVLKVLRDSFMATLKDKAFLADAGKAKLSIEATSGEKVNALVTDMYAAPKDIVELAKKIIKP
ncbi:MAG: Bug family tripartite tricarboxylate transporter substrate binding protein [Beijerinckiaceae bacterium]